MNLNDPDLCRTCKRGVGASSYVKVLLIWRPEKHEEGLARVIEAPRGARLFANDVEVATVIANRVSPMQYQGWVWSTGNEPSEKFPFKIPRANTYKHPVEDFEVAKLRCKTWVKKKLEEVRTSQGDGKLDPHTDPVLPQPLHTCDTPVVEDPNRERATG